MQVDGEDDGELVYSLGEKTLRCTVKGLGTGILNDFTAFEHRLTDFEDYEVESEKDEDDDGDENSDNECAGCDEPAGANGWCTECWQAMLAKKKKEKEETKKKKKKRKAATSLAAQPLVKKAAFTSPT